MPHRNIGINPGVPAVPDLTFDDPNLQQGYDALKESIELLAGVRGDPNYRALTYGEATENGTTELFATNIVLAEAAASQGVLRLEGDITGIGIFSNTGNVTAQTAINLPNVVCIDGGDAAETYPGAVTGPYGVATGGGGGVPDGGTEGQLLIKQSATDGDAVWADWGATTAGSAYCPNYSSYTRVDDDTFTIDLVNAENLFRSGRRVRFSQDGTDTFGVVSSVDYNSTNANDTTVNLTMEGTDTIPTGTFDVCLVTSGTSWSPIAADPFSGDKIYDITTGALSGTQWWVIVGESGKCYTSTDGGVTWTSRTSGTTGNLYTCHYDENNNKFWIGGANTAGTDYYLAYSTNGTTWTEETGTTFHASGSGDYVGYLSGAWNSNFLLATIWDSSTNVFDRYAVEGEFLGAATAKSTTTGVNHRCFAADYHSNNTSANHLIANNTTSQYYTSRNDTGASSDENIGATISAQAYFYITGLAVPQHRVFNGTTTGRLTWNVLGGLQVRDDVSATTQINEFARSDLHERVVAVGNSGVIAYVDDNTVDAGTADAWTSVANGLDPTANFTSVDFNETDGVFVAVADNGQICRSSNGTN